MADEHQTEQQMQEEAPAMQPPVLDSEIENSQYYYAEDRRAIRTNEFLLGFLGGLLLDILAFALLVESSFDGFAIICGAAAAINVLGLILGFLTGRRSFALGIIVNIALAAVPFLAIGACLHWVESGI